jgi:putative transposase
LKTMRQRKSPRLQGYDYTETGAYFITICTHNREMLFGEVVDGGMRLNPIGKITDECWAQIPTHFPNIKIDCYVVMPNHVHGIVIIETQEPVGTTHVSSTMSDSMRPNGPKAGSLGAIIGSYKGAVSRQINQVLNLETSRIWQERFHDHIIRNSDALHQIQTYVQTNPARWKDDTFYVPGGE